MEVGTPTAFEIKKSLTQNTVLQSKAIGDQIGGVYGTGVLMCASPMCVGLHEHGPLPIGRGGASVAKVLSL